jgi:hypothetical protein
MPTPLSPPDYPDRPDAPLFSFGPSFGEEIARSVTGAVFHENLDRPRDQSVRVAASLTMLEAFEPADHLQCMIAAQGVGFHAATMDCLARAIHPDTSPAMAIKFHLSAARMRQAFSGALNDVLKLQGRVPPGSARRPRAKPRPPEPDMDADADPNTDDSPIPDPSDPNVAMTPPDADPPPAADPDEASADELPADIRTRPDGTPGSLAAYMPKQPAPIIPKEAAINLALATRPSPWRQVNVPRDATQDRAPDATTDETPDLAPDATPVQTPLGDRAAPVSPSGEPVSPYARGPLDLREDMFKGDTLARFASARFDPDVPLPEFETDDAIIELELISTGGDPELEAHRAALIAAHPEGKPIAIIRLGANAPSRIEDEVDPPDTS